MVPQNWVAHYESGSGLPSVFPVLLIGLANWSAPKLDFGMQPELC